MSNTSRFRPNQVKTNCQITNLFWIGVAIGFLIIATGLYLNQSPVEVIWQAENTIQLVGFNLWRSDSADGPYVQINDTLIPIREDPLEPGQYRYLDRSPHRNSNLFYQVEEIGWQGNRERKLPVQVQNRWMIKPILVFGIIILMGSVFGLFILRGFHPWWNNRVGRQ
jgi:hypothetical protein